jgi:hypothetical protein
MQRLLFIGFSYHQKTGSCDFILELLRRRFDVTVCWADLYADEPYCGLDSVAGAYDVLVCWQAMPPRAILTKHVRYRHAAFFPMLDSCPSVSKPERWYPYRDFQIICFSSGLGRRLNAAGFSAHTIQYFPEPAVVGDWGNPRAAFFWFRREEIDCRLAETLFRKMDLGKLHVHNVPDPGVSPASPPGGGRLDCECSTWFLDRAELRSTMSESAFYIAPRAKEGIGMSFLEAMAMGRCVVAPNRATMNEYIEHGKTGLLYDLRKPEPLSMDDVRDIQARAHRFISEGFREWEQKKLLIFDWLVAPVKINRYQLLMRMVFRFFRNPMKVVRVLSHEHGS